MGINGLPELLKSVHSLINHNTKMIKGQTVGIDSILFNGFSKL